MGVHTLATASTSIIPIRILRPCKWRSGWNMFQDAPMISNRNSRAYNQVMAIDHLVFSSWQGIQRAVEKRRGNGISEAASAESQLWEQFFHTRSWKTNSGFWMGLVRMHQNMTECLCTQTRRQEPLTRKRWANLVWSGWISYHMHHHCKTTAHSCKWWFGTNLGSSEKP